jgi:hypothetical protein
MIKDSSGVETNKKFACGKIINSPGKKVLNTRDCIYLLNITRNKNMIMTWDCLLMMSNQVEIDRYMHHWLKVKVVKTSSKLIEALIKDTGKQFKALD